MVLQLAGLQSLLWAPFSQPQLGTPRRLGLVLAFGSCYVLGEAGVSGALEWRTV